MKDGRIVLDDVVVRDIPPHVHPRLVVDFDYMQPFGMQGGDVYRVLSRLHEGPDVVWTPHHGGHWLITRGQDIRFVQENWQVFSAAEKSVPRGRMPHMPPITVDPPDHTRYRAVLNPYFGRKKVEEGYEPKTRAVMCQLIEQLRARGGCEFVEDFAFVAPIAVFFDFVDLPYGQREAFLSWGRTFGRAADPQARYQAHRSIIHYLGGLLEERLVTPGPDIFTGISQWRNNPRFHDLGELVGMAQLVFLGGQDTVAAQLGFAMWRLAERPELQQQLKDAPELIPAAVEELLRRHALSSTARLVMQDTVLKGATLLAGDMIFVMGPLSGIDSRLYDDPFRVDFSRGAVAYNSLGNGPHKCVGQHLARLEMRVFLEEWSKQMPIVRFAADRPAPSSHAGAVIGVEHLHLAWDVAA